jgi:16S rRNA (guanine527-N7)-methyltransferase
LGNSLSGARRQKETQIGSSCSICLRAQRLARSDTLFYFVALDSQPRLDELLAAAGLTPLQATQNKKLINYLSLLLRWNARTNLTAVRDADSILERHFVESIACAQFLPPGIATLLDYGSGAGFPGLPIAICRPEIVATLAESQNKKAAFLREAVRSTGVSARVHSDRAETLDEKFDCVTLRAVDRMELAVRSAGSLVALGGWLAPLTTYAELPETYAAAGALYDWSDVKPLPGSDQRVLALGQRRG